ncbi:hypothetical protein ABZ135_18435 [Streptomyces sp. NPDC006339]|uniref:hypothetical protein n=1 Tax=Streptomyces sp. NPDC006339 TaxID=3156755 RepID=UPI0033A44FF3
MSPSASVPGRLLPHTVTVVAPVAVTDSYGNTVYDYGPAATRTPAAAWLEQTQRTQVTVNGADPLQARWLMVTTATVPRRARIEWTAPDGPMVFEVDGRPGPLYNPLAMAASATAAPHHTELTLKVIDG